MLAKNNSKASFLARVHRFTWASRFLASEKVGKDSEQTNLSGGRVLWFGMHDHLNGHDIRPTGQEAFDIAQAPESVAWLPGVNDFQTRDLIISIGYERILINILFKQAQKLGRRNKR